MFASPNKLQHNATSTLSASKAFLKDYRKIYQEIKMAREQLPVEPQRDKHAERLQILLENQGKRLSEGIRSILDGVEASSTGHYDAPAERELWKRFGATNPREFGRPSQWEMSEGWTKTTKSSEKALRRLVRCLPEDED